MTKRKPASRATAPRPSERKDSRKPTGRRRISATKSAERAPHVAVRMYNVGFGDCFLIRLPTAAGERRMLVDCGYHSQGPGMFKDRDLVEQLKRDLGGHDLDVVVATHRHQDHISGFGEKDLWADVGVEEVWLPFTAAPEAEREEPALAVWNRLLKAAGSLVDAKGALSPIAARALGARAQEQRDAVAFMLWNARENAPGIENLRNGMRRRDGRPSRRRYLPAQGKDIPFELTTEALPGIRVHVLGPPRDPASRKSRKVPDGWGLVGDGSLKGGAPPGSPFGQDWHIPPSELPARLPFKDQSLQEMRRFNDDLLAAAGAVDGFLNGESLVLLIEVERARLLLTGDAEVGAWTKILGTPDALTLAAGATFFKIGHHGSHNATPLIFLTEHLAERVPVMMSTQEGPGRYRNGIPRREILEKLKDRHMPCARSDAKAAPVSAMFEREPQGRWIDCFVPC